MWVVRDGIVDYEGVAGLVEHADSLNINVLFVQIRGRGDAYYKSHFAPSPDNYPDIPGNFDPLATVIELAHARGIEVHAWFNMYFTWSPPEPPVDPRHPLNRHPEWFMVSRTGVNMGKSPIESIRSTTVEGRYLSPGLESVRLYLSRVISEVVVNYNVDGVHLDYVRYPSRDYDFHSVVRSHFKRRYGIDPLDLINGDANLDPELRFLEEWVHFRVRQIDRNVRDIARRIDLLDSDIRLSAAVKPHADEAYYEYGQNWVGWLKEGIVDFVAPMSYLSENGIFERIFNDSLEKVDKRKVIGGIGVYKITPQETIEQISILRDMGLLGYCLFSYNTLKENPRYMKQISSILHTGGKELPSDFKPYLRRKR